MEKGIGEFFLAWWRQPFDFAWTVRNLRSRGVLRVHQFFVGGYTVMYGVTALLMVLWGTVDGGPVGGEAFVLAVAISTGVVGAAWVVGPWPSERWSAVFAVYADVGVVAVISCCASAFTAMPGLALLAANAVYITIFHGPRPLLVHLVGTIVVFGSFYGTAVAQAEQPITVITVRMLVLLPIVVGLPVIVQSYLLALRMGAVDALIDPLTRLLNRRGLDVDAEELVSGAGPRIGVLAVDIDKFKAINDAHGHETGDRVLIAVANAVRDAVALAGVRAVIARTGGEEFVAVIAAESDTVQRVAELVHRAVDRIDGGVTPSVSIGVATKAPDGLRPADAFREMVDRADALMYRAKNAGGKQTATDEIDAVGDAVAARNRAVAAVDERRRATADSATPAQDWSPR